MGGIFKKQCKLR